jgi:signal transduction histidine kinase
VERNVTDAVNSPNAQQYSAAQFQRAFPKLFANCHQSDVEVLLNAFMPTGDITAGTVLIQQDHPSDCLYLVCSGLLSVVLESDSKRFNLGLIGRGQWVGDVSLIEPGPASATVSVLETATFMLMNYRDLNRLRSTNPRTASRLLNALSVELANRLRVSSNMAISIGQKPIIDLDAKDPNNAAKKWITNLGRWLSGLRYEEMEQFAKEELAMHKVELEQKYKHIYFQEKDALLMQERERILSELHDGVGGQLVAMLAMLENSNTPTDQLKDTVRAALDDLRLMIDSLDAIEGDIPVVLGMFRSRIEPRLRAQKIQFHWQVTDLPAAPNISPHEVLQILRILQEAVTNIIKHANADVITVRTDSTKSESGEDLIRIEVGDNGKGLSDSKSTAGYGMETMNRRARELGGTVTVQPDKNGTTVILTIPVTK